MHKTQTLKMVKMENGQGEKGKYYKLNWICKIYQMESLLWVIKFRVDTLVNLASDSINGLCPKVLSAFHQLTNLRSIKWFNKIYCNCNSDLIIDLRVQYLCYTFCRVFKSNHTCSETCSTEWDTLLTAYKLRSVVYNVVRCLALAIQQQWYHSPQTKVLAENISRLSETNYCIHSFPLPQGNSHRTRARIP